MHNDPYKSDWENTVEAAREQENKELSIEYNYPPPPDKKERVMRRPHTTEKMLRDILIMAHRLEIFFDDDKVAASTRHGKRMVKAIDRVANYAADMIIWKRSKKKARDVSDAEDYMEENY